jgi:hypothetical protein
MYAYSVFRGQPDGDSLIPLFEVPGYREVRLGQAPSRVLLDAEGSVAARATRICAGFSNRFEVTCYDTSGAALVRIRRDIGVRRVTDADRALVRTAYLAANRDAPPAVRQAMERATQAFPFAEHTPAFGRLLLSETGELWVSDFDPSATLPGPPALRAPKRTDRTVFAADGTWLANIVLPARFLAYEMGRDYVAGVVFDEDDEEHVTLFRLRR